MITRNKLAIILGGLMLSVTALTQTTNSGNVLSVGQVNNGGGGGGAPQTYNARTDVCVTGLEVGCSGLGLSFQMRTTDAVPFANLAPMNSSVTDPDFHSYLVMVTDRTSNVSTNSWNVHSAGQEFINGNSTLLWAYTTGGQGQMFTMNPAAVHLHLSPCSDGAGHPCIAKATIRSGSGFGCTSNCTITDGNVVFSRVPGENYIMYELPADAPGNNHLINKLTIAPDGSSFSRATYVDFTSDTPVPCSVLPSNFVSSGWNGVLAISYDGSITLSLGGAPDWLPSHTYVATESFIFPQVNNGGTPSKGFQATAVTGNSGSSEPNWALNCPNAGDTCTDGGVSWTNIGKVTGQGYAFTVVNYRPGIGCSSTNTYIGKVYRGTGVTDPAGSWTTDDDMVCPEYGVTYPGTCPLTDTFTIHDSMSAPTSSYAPLTSADAGHTSGILAPGTVSCAPGSANYLGAWNAGTAYVAANNDTVYDPAHTPHSLYVAIANSTGQPPFNNPTYWSISEMGCYGYFWQVNSTIVRPCMTRGGGTGKCDGHDVYGNVYAYKGSSTLAAHSYSRLTIAGVANPGFATMPTIGYPDDQHTTYFNAGLLDNTPIVSSVQGVPSGTYAQEGNKPYHGELVGSLFDNTGPLAQYRFAHTYSSGVNADFYAQNSECDNSQDGQFALCPTDVMGTRGSTSPDWIASHSYALGDTIFPTSGNAGNYDFQILTPPSANSGGTEPTWCQTNGCTVSDGGVTWTNLGKSCNQLRALFDPAKNASFSVGDTVFPVINNQAAADLFQATQAGTTYSSLPNWQSLIPNWGNTLCDDAGHEVNQACSAGVVQWTNIGPNDCRSDIMLVDLLSAH